MQGSTGNYLSFAKQTFHNPWLDMLRSLAIFLVLLRHGARADPESLGDGFVYNLFSNGWVGVDLFFVLSGYLIGSGLIRRFATRQTLFPAGYFKDRILRIVPAYYAVLFLCLLGFFPDFKVVSENLGLSTVAHLLFLQDYTGSDINVVFWSLGVEEKFYILAPVLVLLLLRTKSVLARALLAASLLLISPISRGLTFENIGHALTYPEFWQAMRSPFHMSFEGFVVGIMVALLRSSGWALPRTRALAGLALIAGLLVALLGSHDFYAHLTRVDAWLLPTILSIIFGAMLLCATSLAEERMRFEPFFRVNARLSYALYLVHYPLIPLALVLGRDQNSVIFWAVYLLLSYAAAMLLHFGVEKPFLLFKQKLNIKEKSSVATKASEAVPS